MKRVTRSRQKKTKKTKRSRPARALVVSDLTAQRLSVYLRCLDDLLQDGIETISSQHLARRLRLNSAQIRKDLACFGAFGVRGVGYVVSDLKQNLENILGLTRERPVVIIGAGNLGMALADYGGFNRDGLSMAGLFDADEAKVGRVTRGGFRIRPMSDLGKVASRTKVSMAILAIPAPVAQQVLDQVVQTGIRAVLNFAPVRLRAPARVTLKEVDLRIQLENLVFHLTRAEGHMVRRSRAKR